MSPRTNDNAPETGHGDREEAAPGRPTLRTAETGSEKAVREAWERAFGAGGADAPDERADAPHPARTPAADSARDGAAVTGSATPKAEEAACGARSAEPTPEEQASADTQGGGRTAPSPPAEGPEAGEATKVTEVTRATEVEVTEITEVTEADATEADGEATDAPVAATAESPGPADERVAAVRRFSAAGRRWRGVQLAVCAASLAVALTAGAVVVGALRDSGTVPVASTPGGVSPELLAGGDLDGGIRALQAHLRAQPRDYGSWATLGLAYVEQARTKGDPSRYPQAERALERSLRVRPGNDAALAGRAALAAARHDFTGALDYAEQALRQNPYSERALCSRIDALVELGRYGDASKAADLADSRHPGVPVFTRYAYVHELRGDVGTARRVLEQALDTATSRGDTAYVATALGQLAWSQGQYETALDFYARALAADDTYLPALEGRARAQAARGDTAGAVRGMEQVVERYPLPQPLVELGELYEARGTSGDPAKARDQYALVDAWVSLARANGVDADLDTALAAADHGDRAAALKAARAEWARRHTVHTADALAWALHVNGRDQEALPYARQATATGYRNAAFLYHRGMIERATGDTGQARASLTAALELNPGFSPLGAREARKALEAMR
ncbi:tetratricopeptide repeat protein [Streptomyces sp. NPDC001796]|uniref:tetratricopeptide repeat protein n=1 Tax=Streptomyces sp. NPDC001796 TaxID=3364609 RepID=UPI0036CFF3D4